MDRLAEMRRFVSKDSLGLEVAPYFNPLTPRWEGYKCHILDVFPTEKLHELAKVDANIPNNMIENIEPVDYVMSATEIANLKDTSPAFGSYAYIVSSHNFEHLPNPIKFLQGAYAALTPGGTLSMAIPDYRRCFDRFRMPTRVADWVRWYDEDRDNPEPSVWLDSNLHFAKETGKRGYGPNSFYSQMEPAQVFEHYRTLSSDYNDAHVTTTCPELFNLLMYDLRVMGLTKFWVASLSYSDRNEFFVHLRKDDSKAQEAFNPDTRNALLRAASFAVAEPQGASGDWICRHVKSKRVQRSLRKIFRQPSAYLVSENH